VLTAALMAGTVAGLGSVPHCAAMCGPLAAYACGRAPGAGGPAGAVVGPLRYQLGRMLGYAVLGALAGGFGGVLAAQLSVPWGRAVVSWTLAAALLWSAWRFWRQGAPRARTSSGALVPPARLHGGGAPAGGGWLPRLARGLPRDPTVVGALTAMLPCGALYAAVAIAAGTGSALRGALAMVAFSLASGIGVLGAAALAARLRAAARPEALRMLAVALALGGLVLAIRPIATLRGEPVLCHDPSPAEPSGPASPGPRRPL